jgi:transcriptional antiterminator NusG
MESQIFAIRTAANREDQVLDYLIPKLEKESQLEIFSVIRPHGMRGYIFIEAGSKADAEIAVQRIPYARGLLPGVIPYPEIEHMLEQVKVEMNIHKADIVELISGPFKRESAKVIRINKAKEEIVVELLEAAVPIPITVSMDAVKVIRRENDSDD